MIKQRLAANAVANIYTQGVTVLTQLVSVPVFLAFWSKEHYGEWLLISSVPAYLSLAEAGVSTASANQVSIFVAEGSMAKARRSLHTAWGFMLAVSLVLAVLSLPASFLIPWPALLNLPHSTSNLSLVLFLLCLYAIIALGASIFGAVYRGAYRTPRIGFILSTGRLMELVATAVCASQTISLVTLAAVLLSIRALTAAVLFFDGLRIAPQLRLGLADFSPDELKGIWRPSLMFMATTLGNAVYFQGLTLLVGQCLGPVAVVTFNTMRMMTRSMSQVVATIKQVSWAEFSYLIGAGDLPRARRLNELAFEMLLTVAVGVSAVLFFAAPWVLSVWTHKAVPFDAPLLLIFLLSAVLNSIWWVVSGALMGVNRHEGLAVRYLLAAAVSLLVGMILISRLELRGVAWAMVLCDVLMIPYTIRSVCALLQCPPRRMILDVLSFRQLRLLGGQLLARLGGAQPGAH